MGFGGQEKTNLVGGKWENYTKYMRFMIYIYVILKGKKTLKELTQIGEIKHLLK